MSIVHQLQVLIQQALLADAQLLALIGANEVHSMKPPAGAVPPYIVLGVSDENDFSIFQSNRGTRGTEQIIFYSKFKDKLEAADGYAHIKRILHRKRFQLDTGEIVYLRIRLVGIDQDESGLARSIAELRAVSPRAAA